MFVRVRLPIGAPHDAILVPQEAVGTDQGKKYLKVVDDRDTVEYRPIELGEQQPDGLQVVVPVKMIRTKDGLQQANGSTPADAKTFDSIALGERVIVGGLQFVHAGMHVTPKPVEQTSTPIDNTPGPVEQKPAPIEQKASPVEEKSEPDVPRTTRD